MEKEKNKYYCRYDYGYLRLQRFDTVEICCSEVHEFEEVDINPVKGFFWDFTESVGEDLPHEGFKGFRNVEIFVGNKFVKNHFFPVTVTCNCDVDRFVKHIVVLPTRMVLIEKKQFDDSYVLLP